MNPELMNEIRLKAYDIYERSGCIEGRDLENWLEAEQELLEKHSEKSNPIDQALTKQSDSTSCACVSW
jgi:hypothetical protein